MIPAGHGLGSKLAGQSEFWSGSDMFIMRINKIFYPHWWIIRIINPDWWIIRIINPHWWILSINPHWWISWTAGIS
jgi:hypothetical protein